MKSDAIRSQNDRELFDELLEERDVKRVREQLAKREEEGPTGVRRRLLATSVRLSPGMAPEVHQTAGECIARLGIDIPVELYVYASPLFNAACIKPEEGRLFIMFSSSLLEAFQDRELRFVIGHELGHYLYRHHDIPIGHLLRGRQRPGAKLALTLFAWSRYAEISADRAGAHCARDLSSVARALFRLTSGLSERLIRFSLEDFLAQVDDMQVVDGQPGQGAPKEDWFSTHPFSPLRVKALHLFSNSELAAEGGMSVAELELATQRLMSLMEPSYLQGRTDTAEVMRRLLFAGAIAVAGASGGIGGKEIEVFEKFFGKGSYREDLAPNKLEADLDARIARTREMTAPPQRMQVLHDLCIVARADGRTSEAEREVLLEIAEGLQLPAAFVTKTLDAEAELD